MDHLLSTADVAELLGLAEWQPRRLFEDGSLPEPQRFAGKRVVSKQLLRRIREAAIARGWLKDETAARSTETDPENRDRPPPGPRKKTSRRGVTDADIPQKTINHNPNSIIPVQEFFG